MPTHDTFALVPPHATDLEEAVLGAMLQEAAGLTTGLSMLRGREEVFYQPKHRVIFRAIVDLHNAGLAVDLRSVTHKLLQMGTVEQAGGTAAVAELTFKIQSSANLFTHCLLLLEYYTKREVASVARLLLAKAYEETQDTFALLSSAQTSLNSLHDTLQLKRPRSVGELYHGVVDEIVHATQQSGGLTGVPSGLTLLDKLTGGWQKSDLIIIAARPGMGKTSLMLANGRFAAGAGYPGAIFSLEMSSPQLVRKMIATEAGYTTSQLQRGKLSGGREEAEHIRQKAAALAEVGLYIDDTPGLSIGELRAKATKLKAEHGITWLAVDYLQLMRGDNPKGGNREQEISSISRGLKMLAKELDIPVIALAQLSRSVETRGGDKRPMPSDLRESGAIEQDADMILFPFRPEYYGIDEDAFGGPTKDTTELIVAKHRNGSTATGEDALVVSSKMAFGRYADIDPSPVPAGERPMPVGNGETVAFGQLPPSNDSARTENDAF